MPSGKVIAKLAVGVNVLLDDGSKWVIIYIVLLYTKYNNRPLCHADHISSAVVTPLMHGIGKAPTLLTAVLNVSDTTTDCAEAETEYVPAF